MKRFFLVALFAILGYSNSFALLIPHSFQHIVSYHNHYHNCIGTNFYLLRFIHENGYTTMFDYYLNESILADSYDIILSADRHFITNYYQDIINDKSASEDHIYITVCNNNVGNTLEYVMSLVGYICYFTGMHGENLTCAIYEDRSMQQMVYFPEYEPNPRYTNPWEIGPGGQPYWPGDYNH